MLANVLTPHLLDLSQRNSISLLVESNHTLPESHGHRVLVLEDYSDTQSERQEYTVLLALF